MAPGISRCQILRGDADVVLLPCGVNFRQHRHIRQLQLLHELGKQRLGARVGVGLEGTDDPLIAHGCGRWSAGHGAHRDGGRSRRRPPPRDMSPCAPCGGQRRGRSPTHVDTASPGRPSTYAADAAASVLRMLCLPGISSSTVGIDAPRRITTSNTGQPSKKDDVGRRAVRRPILHGEGEHRVLHVPSRPSRAPASSALEMMQPRCGTRSAKAWKECSNIRQILEKVQVIRLHVKDRPPPWGRSSGKELQYSQDSRMMVSPLPTR